MQKQNKRKQSAQFYIKRYYKENIRKLHLRMVFLKLHTGKWQQQQHRTKVIALIWINQIILPFFPFQICFYHHYLQNKTSKNILPPDLEKYPLACLAKICLIKLGNPGYNDSVEFHVWLFKILNISIASLLQ